MTTESIAWMGTPAMLRYFPNIVASRRTFLTLAAIALCLLTFILYHSHPGLPTRGMVETSMRRLQSPVYNRTLGFGKVYAIGFPGRTDKRDALILASSYSGFDIEWADAVAIEEIPDKAVPESFHDTTLPETSLASWRAHLNLLSRIVQDNIQTALIFEDDTDWDVSVKAQLEMFAKGSSQIQGVAPSGSPQRSPYGSSWDYLWLGHCRAGPTDLDQNLYFIHNDPTVPPLPFRHSIWRQSHLLPEVRSNDTRIVFKAHAGMCTFAYAVSLNGARKILASLSLQGNARSFDVEMSAMCLQRYAPFDCYSIYPPLFSSHRFAGSIMRDSDLQDHTGDKRVHPEFTWDIVYSVIQNVPRLATGADNVTSQWPNDTLPFRGLSESYSAQVQGELRAMQFRDMDKEYVKGIND